MKLNLLFSSNNRIVNILKASLFITIFLMVFDSSAHGDLSERIRELTQEIIETPNDSELYLERGYLYQQHLEFDNALKDYAACEKLGLNTKLLFYRKTEALFFKGDYSKALTSSRMCLQFDNQDVKSQKIRAQILINLNNLTEAFTAYTFVIEHTIDLKPEDIIEYSNLKLAINPEDYNEAINILDSGLEKLGPNTFSLQLKKLEYFKSAKQEQNTINQYNYFIINNKRKEFWYYKKSTYLIEINKKTEALIAIKQAKLAIQQLDTRFQEMKSIKDLTTKLETLENQLSNEN